MSFQNFLYKNKSKCNKCSKTEVARKSALKEEDIKTTLAALGFTFIGTYQTARIPITYKDKDGYIYQAVYHNILKNNGSKLISNKNEYTIHNIRLWLLLNKSDIKLLSDKYVSKSKFEWECQICKCIWKATWNNISRISGCPECSQSKGEKEIQEWLNSNGIEFISQKEFEGLIGVASGNLTYDFYLPKCNLLIEYQGQQHEKYIRGFHKSKRDYEKQKEHDRRKLNYSRQYKIKLLEIWYYEFDNIKEILSKNILDN